MNKLNLPDAAAVVVALILAGATGVSLMYAAAGCLGWTC